ncbi:thioesterase-like superfamily-domain-containing protein [Mrakia frigida]|uniref:palmitoyl-CoA hydrolase n=1 Tax=Mrakia frigida TaxID=29902 RepID=UPI003FCC1A2A
MANDIRNSLKLAKVDELIWTSAAGLEQFPGARGLFGGQILGQALVAATNCVKPEYSLHSMQCYFLSAASAATPLIFLVTPLRRGRSYQVLSVEVRQNGSPVFSLACSFQLPEPRQPSFQIPFPSNVPAPENCEMREDKWQAVIEKEGAKWKESTRKHLQMVIDERRDSPIAIMDAVIPGLPQNRGAYWLKARGIAPGELSAPLQKAVVGYLSDFLFIGQGAKALGMKSFEPPGSPGLHLDMMVSLDHHIHYYSDSFDTSDWLLHVIEASRAGSGRASVHGRLYTRQGELIAVTSQEGVVRAKLSPLEDDEAAGKKQSKL